jgi:hypothetical protein
MTPKRQIKHKPEQIVAKLHDADAMLNAGKDMAGALQALEISLATLTRLATVGAADYRRWPSSFSTARSPASPSAPTPATHQSPLRRVGISETFALRRLFWPIRSPLKGERDRRAPIPGRVSRRAVREAAPPHPRDVMNRDKVPRRRFVPPSSHSRLSRLQLGLERSPVPRRHDG